MAHVLFVLEFGKANQSSVPWWFHGNSDVLPLLVRLLLSAHFWLPHFSSVLSPLSLESKGLFTKCLISKGLSS